MSTTGFLFQDHTLEGDPYTLFIEGLEPEDDEDVKTIEVRFDSAWEAFRLLSSIADDLGEFPIVLDMPPLERLEEAREEES